MINTAEELLKEGLAEVEYIRFLPQANEAVYRIAQKETKKQKLSIWRLVDYVKPYDWRHRQENGQ